MVSKGQRHAPPHLLLSNSGNRDLCLSGTADSRRLHLAPLAQHPSGDIGAHHTEINRDLGRDATLGALAHDLEAKRDERAVALQVELPIRVAEETVEIHAPVVVIIVPGGQGYLRNISRGIRCVPIALSLLAWKSQFLRFFCE